GGDRATGLCQPEPRPVRNARRARERRREAMSFKLDEQEDVSEGIRRIIVERIDDALGSLRSKAGASLSETVHTARKRFKEARAALRLVRDELGEERFADGNRALRDAGRPLSEVR